MAEKHISGVTPGFRGVPAPRVARVAALLGAASLPSLAAPQVGARVEALAPLAIDGSAYFVASHAAFLYVITPVVVASAVVLVLAPGLLLAIASGRLKSVGDWFVRGFAISFLLVSVLAEVADAIAGRAVRGSAFSLLVLACTALSGWVAVWRVRRRSGVVLPLDEPHAGATMTLAVVVPLALLIALSPKFYWESMNGDGASAFESARLLLHQPLPFWPASSGSIRGFPGLSSMSFAFPVSWFIRVFGEVDLAARVPLLLFLPPLVGSITELADHGGDTRMRTPERALVWFAVVIYVVTVAYSATYDPYNADIALPAVQDTLFLVFLFGLLAAFLRGDGVWIAIFVLLSYLSLPSGPIVMAMWLVAVVLVVRPLPRRQMAWMVGSLLACVAVGALVPRLLSSLDLPGGGREYAVREIWKYVSHLRFDDWRRVLLAAVPGGILPALTAFAWWRQDRAARALALLSGMYFLFFFVQANTVLHYYIPVMLLPVAIHWRIASRNGVARLRWLVASAVLAAAAFALSLPRDPSPNVTARIIGPTISSRVPGYEHSDPAAFRHSDLLSTLFAYDWSPLVPSHLYGGSPLAWNRYARRDGQVDGSVNYVLQPIDQPVPDGMRLVSRDDGAALYVRSDSIWVAHRSLRPPTPAGSPIYAIPRSTMLRPLLYQDEKGVIDVEYALRRVLDIARRAVGRGSPRG